MFHQTLKYAGATLAAGVVALAGGPVLAAGIVQWTAPANNSSYMVGTNVSPITGRADGFGTGEGLTISQHLVELMLGRISGDSVE